MKKIWNWLKDFFSHWLYANIVISALVTLITFICRVKEFYVVGLVTFAGLGVLVILIVWLRQLWWWITSTGDYEKKDTEK
jgi:cytochrome b561